jgi:hypothetical protein
VTDSPGPAKPPEKRKVGGSTPPLTTTCDQGKRPVQDRDPGVFSCSGLSLGPISKRTIGGSAGTGKHAGPLVYNIVEKSRRLRCVLPRSPAPRRGSALGGPPARAGPHSPRRRKSAASSAKAAARCSRLAPAPICQYAAEADRKIANTLGQRIGNACDEPRADAPRSGCGLARRCCRGLLSRDPAAEEHCDQCNDCEHRQ